MPTQLAQPAPRKPRADAQRNRVRILEIAKDAFTRLGVNISMDDIAKQAGIGAGTLYRHFPTREALLAAVYRSEVAKLAEAEKKLAETLPPMEALRAWMLIFVDYIATKRIIAPALNSIVESSCEHCTLFEESGTLIKGAIDALVGRAIASGEIRSDLDPLDLLWALIGVSNVAYMPDWEQSARRLVQILLAGSRPGV